MGNRVTEYYITYKDRLDEFITEDKEQADEEFRKTDKGIIDQYFRKDWILVDGEWYEDNVEVYY